MRSIKYLRWKAPLSKAFPDGDHDEVDERRKKKLQLTPFDVRITIEN